MGAATRIVIHNDMAGLAELVRQTHEFLAPFRFSPRVSHAVDLGIEEIVTNAIKYGFDDQDVHEIITDVSFENEDVVVVVQDDGHEFDPSTHPIPKARGPLAERRAGGLGLHLVREMTDGLAYRRRNGWNVIEFRVNRHEG